MVGLRVRIRTMADITILLACILGRIRSEDRGTNTSGSNTLSKAKTESESSSEESQLQQSHPNATTNVRSSNIVPRSQFLRHVAPLNNGMYKGEDMLSNYVKETVTVLENDFSTSQPLSSFSTNTTVPTDTTEDTSQMMPFKYSKTMSLFSRTRGSNQSRKAVYDTEVRVSVLLPFSGDRLFDLNKVAPAIEYAVDRVATNLGPWNFRRFTIFYADSKCDIADAMNEAIHLYERLMTVAYFGPVCDYALAPVARQARFWKTPIISAGGTASNFHYEKNLTYSTLTRVGPVNLQMLSEFFEQLIAHNHWRKCKLVYDLAAYDETLQHLSYLIVDYLDNHFATVNNRVAMTYYKVIRGQTIDPDTVLRSVISTDYSGRKW